MSWDKMWRRHQRFTMLKRFEARAVECDLKCPCQINGECELGCPCPSFQCEPICDEAKDKEPSQV